MTPLVASAVLPAAVTHAGWNAIAHRITAKLTGFTLISGGGVLIGLAALPFTAFPAGPAWPHLLTSAVVHVAYLSSCSGNVPEAGSPPERADMISSVADQSLAALRHDGNSISADTPPHKTTYASYGVYRLKSYGYSQYTYVNCGKGGKKNVTIYTPHRVGWAIWES